MTDKSTRLISCHKLEPCFRDIGLKHDKEKKSGLGKYKTAKLKPAQNAESLSLQNLKNGILLLECRGTPGVLMCFGKPVGYFLPEKKGKFNCFLFFTQAMLNTFCFFLFSSFLLLVLFVYLFVLFLMVATN